MAVPIATLRKLLKARGSLRTELERLAYPSPPAWTDGKQMAFWITIGTSDKPWPKAPFRIFRFRCVSGYCENRVTAKGRYCADCKKRLASGLPLDLDDYLTDRERRTLAKRVPGNFGKFVPTR